MKLSVEHQVGFTLMAICIGPLLVILGACITLESSYYQNTWQPVPAVVTYAGTTRGTRHRSSHSTFKYQYVVNGERFNGCYVNHGMLSAWTELDEQLAVRRFPTRSDITVYYDPDSPKRSVLWNKVPLEGPAEIILGGLLFIFGFISLQKLKNTKATPKEKQFQPTAEMEKNEHDAAINDWLDKRSPQSTA